MPKVLVTDVDPGFLPARHRGFRGARWEECGDCITPQIISPRTTWKLPVRVTSETNVSLSPPPATVDSVTLADEDRIGLVGQTDATENGIYLRKTLTEWERDSDFINGAVTEAGAEFYTQEGTLNTGKTYLLTTQGDIDVGTTPLTFVDNSPSGGPGPVESISTPGTGVPGVASTTSSTFVNDPLMSLVVPTTGLWWAFFEAEARYSGGPGPQISQTVEIRIIGGTFTVQTRQVTNFPNSTNRQIVSSSRTATPMTAGQTVRVQLRRGAAVTGTASLLRRKLTIMRVG